MYGFLGRLYIVKDVLILLRQLQRYQYASVMACGPCMLTTGICWFWDGFFVGDLFDTPEELHLHTDSKTLLILHGLVMSVSFPLLPSDICHILTRTCWFWALCFRCIAFHPDGMCLYSGSKDVLKVYGWEPIECYDTVPVAWGDVCDMSISNTQLVSRLNWYIVVTPYEWNPTAPPPPPPPEKRKKKDSGWSQKQRFISMVFCQGGLFAGWSFVGGSTGLSDATHLRSVMLICGCVYCL